MSKIHFKIEKGRLGKDPEISYNDDNNCMARLSIAVNRYRYDKKTKEYEQEGIATWINAVAFGYKAELIEEMELEKGDNVFAEGIMYQVEYEDKDGDLLVDMNYYLDRLFKIPETYSDDEDDGKRSNRKKKKRKLKKRSRSSSSNGSSSKRKSKIPNLKTKKKSSKKDLASSVLKQLKNG